MWVDESGFYLLPALVRTYAPIGQTPVLYEHLTRDHLSAISGISLEGKLYMLEQEESLKGPDVVRFLRHLLDQIARNVCCGSLGELRQELEQAKQRLRRKPNILRSCIKQPGYV